MRTFLLFARLVGKPSNILRAFFWGLGALLVPLSIVGRSPLDSSANWFPALGDTAHVAALWQSTLVFALLMGTGTGSLIRREMSKMTSLTLPGARNSITALYVVLAAAVTTPAWLFMAAHPVWPTQITFVLAAFMVFAVAVGGAEYPNQPWLNIAAIVFMILVVLWPSLFGTFAEVAPRAFYAICVVVAVSSFGLERSGETWQSRVEDKLTGRAEREVAAPPLAPVSLPTVASAATPAAVIPKQPRYGTSSQPSSDPQPSDLRGHDFWSHFRAVVFENEGEGFTGKTRYPILLGFMILGCIVSRFIWHHDAMVPFMAVSITLEEMYDSRLLRTQSRDMRALLVFLASTRKTLILLALSYAAIALTRLAATRVALPAIEEGFRLETHLVLGSLILVLMPFVHWSKMLVKRRWKTSMMASLAGIGIGVAVVIAACNLVFRSRREPQFGLMVVVAGLLTYSAFYLLLRWRFSRADLVYRP